jgi:hypothetical protein
MEGVSVQAVPPGRGDAAVASDPSYAVCDDLIRILPFVSVDAGPYARQYMLQVDDVIDEPSFTARGSSKPWTPGTTLAFGEELAPVGARFKKVGVTVRIDELMAGDVMQDVLDVQVELAHVAIIRALSEAILHSNPVSDDDGEFSGLPFFLASGGDQDITYDQSRGMIGGLSEIEARCRSGDDGLGAGPDVFVMSSRARWRLMKELEDKGLQPETRWCEWVGRDCLHFHGLPVVGGRVPEPASAIPSTEAWALTLSGPTAVQLLHIEGDAFGLREDPVTTVAGLNASGEANSTTRGVEVYGVYSLLVPDSRTIARLRQIPAGDPFSQP